MEIPIEFFLRLSWDPDAIPRDGVEDFVVRWAEREFGPDHAPAVADVVNTFTKYNGSWRKPELVTAETFSLLHYREAERVLEAWREVRARAEAVYAALPEEHKAAFYQLVLYPAKASYGMNAMAIAAARSLFYARQGRISANDEAARVRELFLLDDAMSRYYNEELSDGKWNHLMDQAHVGQFAWEPPRVNLMPPVSGVLPRDTDDYGVAIEGNVNAWPGTYEGAVLPTFDSFDRQRSYIDVFPEGTRPIDFEIEADDPWIVLTPAEMEGRDRRFWVEVDWDQFPPGRSTGTVTVTGTVDPVTVQVVAEKATEAQQAEAAGRFATLVGPLSIAAHEATANVPAGGARWEPISDYGRGEAGMGVVPITAESVLPPGDAPTLEYPVYLPEAGEVEVTLAIGPVMDFVPDRGMRIAVAFGDAAPEVIDIFEDRERETFLGASWWNGFTRDNVRLLTSRHRLDAAGAHTLRVRMVDPGVVVEKIVVAPVGEPAQDSYFGPPVMDRQPAADG